MENHGERKDQKQPEKNQYQTDENRLDHRRFRRGPARRGGLGGKGVEGACHYAMPLRL